MEPGPATRQRIPARLSNQPKVYQCTVGVILLSVYESNIDDTAAGQLAANVFGAINQYSSDAHSEKQKVRARQAAASGRYPRPAMIGFVNVKDKDGARLEHDPERAPFMLRGFSLVKTRRYKVVEVLRILNREGFTTRKGFPGSVQSFHLILRNPFYAGWVHMPSDPSFEPVLVRHTPIVDQATFDEVQEILDGNKQEPETTSERILAILTNGLSAPQVSATRLIGDIVARPHLNQLR